MHPGDAGERVEAFFVDLDRTVFTGDMEANNNLRVEIVGVRSVAGGTVVAVIAPWTIAFLLFYEEPFPSELIVGGRSVPVLENEVPALGRYRSVTPTGGVESLASQDLAREMVVAVFDPLCNAITDAIHDSGVENPSRRTLFRTLGQGDTDPNLPMAPIVDR
jgi:hypothetical protein